MHCQHAFCLICICAPQGVLAEVGKAGSGKLYPLLLQLLKENSRLAGGAAGVTADPTTPLPVQVPCPAEKCGTPTGLSD